MIKYDDGFYWVWELGTGKYSKIVSGRNYRTSLLYKIHRMDAIETAQKHDALMSTLAKSGCHQVVVEYI